MRNIPSKVTQIGRKVLHIYGIQKPTSLAGHSDKVGRDHGVTIELGDSNSIPSKIFLFAITSTMTGAQPISYGVATT
jgi:hypothetical protein